MLGLYFGMIILGIILGYFVTATIVFYSVKNKATIIKVQLLGDKLDESTTLLFAVRRNIATKITYRCPYTINEGLSAFVRKKHWQKQHQRNVLGKPIRASCLKIDDKIISCLHYVATKIEFVEDCIDSMIIHAYSDEKLGLATIGAANNIRKTKDNEEKKENAEKETEYYLSFVKNSITDLNKQAITERQKRVYLSEQLFPLAELIAAEILGVDIIAICKAANLPTLDKIIQTMTNDPKPNSKGEEQLNKLLKKVNEKIATGNTTS